MPLNGEIWRDLRNENVDKYLDQIPNHNIAKKAIRAIKATSLVKRLDADAFFNFLRNEMIKKV